MGSAFLGYISPSETATAGGAVGKQGWRWAGDAPGRGSISCPRAAAGYPHPRSSSYPLIPTDPPRSRRAGRRSPLMTGAASYRVSAIDWRGSVRSRLSERNCLTSQAYQCTLRIHPQKNHFRRMHVTLLQSFPHSHTSRASFADECPSFSDPQHISVFYAESFFSIANQQTASPPERMTARNWVRFCGIQFVKAGNYKYSSVWNNSRGKSQD